MNEKLQALASLVFVVGACILLATIMGGHGHPHIDPEHVNEGVRMIRDFVRP